MAATSTDGTPPLIHGGIGIAMISLVGLVVGLVVVQSLGSDVRASISVYRSGLQAISQTIESVDDVALNTSASIVAASRSVDEASATVDNALNSLDGMATLLEEDITQTIDSIRTSMPAAIQTANTVDRTLRTLSLFGVDYDPEEAFGDSLRRINDSLGTLPTELRAQSESIRALVPSGERLAGEIEELSSMMDRLEQSLAGFTSLTSSYQDTTADAEALIEETDDSISSSLWLLRGLLVAAALVGIAVGVMLVLLGGELADLQARMEELSVEARHDVEAGAPG